MIFRPSRKLATKIKAGELSPLPLADEPLTDWSSHLFVAGRVQYILVSNTRSLYSAVMHARGITEVDRFIKAALAIVRESLDVDGLRDVYPRHILPATGSAQFAGAYDRAVTGSINELIHQAKCRLASADMSPVDVGTLLNETLLSAIAGGGRKKYSTPREALRSMLAGSGS